MNQSEFIENVKSGIARRKVERSHLICVNHNLRQVVERNEHRVKILEDEMQSLANLPAKAEADVNLWREDELTQADKDSALGKDDGDHDGD